MRSTAIAFTLSTMAIGPVVSTVSAAPVVEAGLTPVQSATVAAKGTPVPQFMVDAAWPHMPPAMLLGQVSGVAVDPDDNVWVVHRPNSLTDTDTGLAQSPPTAICCRPAPPVVQFSASGDYLGGFGGAQSAPVIDGMSQWPQSLHGIYVDKDRTIWFAGNGRDDHVVLNYTPEGKFIQAIGRRGQTNGNGDLTRLGNPSDVHRIGDQVLVSDGYINRRAIGFSRSSGNAYGTWGAYGRPPALATRQGAFDQSQATSHAGGASDPHSEEYGGIVHCIVPTGDGQVYVCDRQNNRAQLFDIDEGGRLKFVRDLVVAGETGGLGTVTDIALSPDKKYLYVADMMNGRIWILLRKTHEQLGSIGRIGRQAGQFTWLHSIDTDSRGNLYTTEVSTGRRVQKFVFTGLR